MAFQINVSNNVIVQEAGVGVDFAIDELVARPVKLSGQILTGISTPLLAGTVIAVPILNSMGIWAPFVAANPIFIPVFATVVAILILAFIIGLVLLIGLAYVKHMINSEINRHLLAQVASSR